MEKKMLHFKRWVFWTGIFNIVAYGSLICPFTLRMFINMQNNMGKSLGLGGSEFVFPVSVNNVLMINILGLIVVFLGIFLIIASFDIANRAWFVFWEGLVRIVVFFFCVYFVLAKDATQIMFGIGLVDLIIGLIYMYYIFTIEGLRKVC